MNNYNLDNYINLDKTLFKYYKDKDNINITDNIYPLCIDNRQLCAPPNNQFYSPYCAGYAVSNYFEAIIWKKTGKLIDLNAEKIYIKAKEIDSNKEINGTTLESAIKSALNLCNLDETSEISIVSSSDKNLKEKIKYIIHKFDFALAGITISPEWYYCNNKNYIIKNSNINLGGHAILITGYNKIGCFIQNSWGMNWGSKGFAIIPWEVIQKDILYICYLNNYHTLLN